MLTSAVLREGRSQTKAVTGKQVRMDPARRMSEEVLGMAKIRAGTKGKLFRIAMYRLLGMGGGQAEKDYGWTKGTATRLVQRYPELLREYEQRCYQMAMDRMKQDHTELMQRILLAGRAGVEALEKHLGGGVLLEKGDVAIHKEFVRLAKDLLPQDFETGGSVEDVRELTEEEEEFERVAGKLIAEQDLPDRVVPEPEN